MLEVHTRLAVREASSASVALPEKEINAPDAKLELLTGVMMETTGALFGLTVTLNDALPIFPPESVTVTEIV